APGGRRSRPSPGGLRAELPRTAMGAAGTAAVRVRELTGREIIDLASLQDAVSMGYRIAEVRSKHRRGNYQVDEFGFDRTWTEALIPLFRILYRRYWRGPTPGIQGGAGRGPGLPAPHPSRRPPPG